MADSGSPSVSQYDRVYPEALREQEKKLLAKRRAAAEDGKGTGDWLSVGLSGGGIRSATFSLGVFERWARSPGFLRRIDYLSTVSGGGYFGSFLGRLFSRDFVERPKDVEDILRQEKNPEILRFLRENGRYMAPNGAGDKLLVGAIVLRNWFSLQLVLAVFLLMFFLALQVIRIVVGRYVPYWVSYLSQWLSSLGTLGEQADRWWHAHPWTGHGALWWSPYVLIPPVIFLLFAFPLGWAYWLVEPGAAAIRKASHKAKGLPIRKLFDKSLIAPWLGVFLTLLVGLGLQGLGWALESLALTVAGVLIAVVALATFAAWGTVRLVGWQEDPIPTGSTTKSDDPGLGEEIDAELFYQSVFRNNLSVGLTWALTVTFGLLVLAVIDSLGQTMYALGPAFWGYLAGVASPLLVLVSSAQKIASFLSRGPNNGKQVHFSLRWIATIAALLLALLLLTAIDATSHAIAWNFQTPPSAPRALHATPETKNVPASPPTDGSRDPVPATVGLIAAFLLSCLFGQTWPFVNRSSHHSLYASRLTRAYLGASNEARWSGGTSVTQVLKGDNLDMARYWPPPNDEKTTPLHLINVTVNETVDGRSQTQQTDRKGVGMALGPCGLSVGARHHAVIGLGLDKNADPYGRPVTIYPSGSGEFPVFRYAERMIDGKKQSVFLGEPLPLGDWVGVSGAAFSTGTGAQTSVGISLLTGFANVRLGRWWDSGISPAPRGPNDFKLGLWLETRLARLFSVQISLLDEFLARFPGTARKHWYLSDGGHFENLGGYELIRRRPSVIVIVDAEQDTDYEFGGLANLIRKARLDFEAEIEFLDGDQLDSLFKPGSDLRKSLGTLEDLRRESHAGLSQVHAALARVTYSSPAATSRLIYIKPTLTGDEPTDVLEYHRSHPDFPHEPTSDQFFDEAQWESYRRLGDHIAEKLLPFLTATVNW